MYQFATKITSLQCLKVKDRYNTTTQQTIRISYSTYKVILLELLYLQNQSTIQKAKKRAIVVLELAAEFEIF